MHIGSKPHTLKRIIVHLQGILEPLCNLDLRFVRLVNVLLDFTLHEAALVVDSGVDHAVLDCLGDNVLRVLFRVERELDAHVAQ